MIHKSSYVYIFFKYMYFFFFCQIMRCYKRSILRPILIRTEIDHNGSKTLLYSTTAFLKPDFEITSQARKDPTISHSHIHV